MPRAIARTVGRRGGVSGQNQVLHQGALVQRKRRIGPHHRAGLVLVDLTGAGEGRQ